MMDDQELLEEINRSPVKPGPPYLTLLAFVIGAGIFLYILSR